MKKKLAFLALPLVLIATVKAQDLPPAPLVNTVDNWIWINDAGTITSRDNTESNNFTISGNTTEFYTLSGAVRRKVTANSNGTTTVQSNFQRDDDGNIIAYTNEILNAAGNVQRTYDYQTNDNGRSMLNTYGYVYFDGAGQTTKSYEQDYTYNENNQTTSLDRDWFDADGNIVRNELFNYEHNENG